MKYTSAHLVNRNGKWQAQLSYKDDNGKWQRKSRILVSQGKREAQRELEEWRDAMEEEAEREAMGASSNDTLEQYMEAYIDGRETSVERSTAASYRRLLEKQIAPYIGSERLDDLNPDMIQQWVNDLVKRYSVSVVRKAFILVKSAMTQAVERDRLLKNPTRTVKPPKSPAPKPNALDERGRAIVMNALSMSNPSPAMLGVKIALLTGMREGEICGLRWKNVDIETRRLMVCEAIGNENGKYYKKDPKTAISRRAIYFSDDLAQALTERLDTMERECLNLGATFTSDHYVLGGADGSFFPPHQLSRKWKDLANALELIGTEGKRPTFHDLRHTYATTAIANGVDVKTVSSSMGHANAAMTLNTYASADPDAKRRAAEVMARAYANDAKRGRGDNVIMLGETGTGN